MPIRDELAKALALHKAEHAVFLVTAAGAPFTDAGFGNWFGDACKAAGVSARAHGLRKAAARRLAEAGATTAELQAWGGWKNATEVDRYIQAANRARLADSGAAKVSTAAQDVEKKTRNQLKEKDK